MNFWTQCTTGSFRACASVSAELVSGPFGMTLLRIRVSNLHGTFGYDDGGFRGLKSLQFHGLTSVTHAGSYGATNQRGSEGNARIGPAALDNPLIAYRPDGTATLGFRWDLAAYLYGCDVPEGADRWGPNDETCGGSIIYESAYGSDTFSFTKNSSVQLRWGRWEEDVPWSDAPAEFMTCTSGVNCVTVTPEPGTIVLLTTGLVGLAAARRRRRSEQQ